MQIAYKKTHVLQVLLYGIIIIYFHQVEPLFSATIEEKIRAELTSTADLIVSDHPRVWLKGSWDWDYNNYGSFAWRVSHGQPINVDDPANDQEKQEFYYTVCSDGDYSADYMINEGQTGHTTHGRRILEHIWAGVSQKNNWWDFLPNQLIGTSGIYEPNYTQDQYFAYARERLLGILQPTVFWTKAYTIIYGSIAYDWLYNETYADSTPVLSQSDKTTIQTALISLADGMKSMTDGTEKLFQCGDISEYFYPMVGLALYEPSGQGISEQNNFKAKEYLDDFDTYWIGKILPALNEQGGDGGWHGGVSYAPDVICWWGTPNDWVIPVLMASLLYAHYTATGDSLENSVFSTGVLKHHAEFQNYMIRPGESGYSNGEYYDIGPQDLNRGAWVFQMRTYARRRFSTDSVQQRIAELGNWVAKRYRTQYTQRGSWCMVDQAMFEDKWVSPRSPEELGYGSKHFQKLGWIFMREGFTSADDLAGLFIGQRYHWSHLDPYSQNSFTLERKGELIEGFQNSILIDDEYQRQLSSFPTITDGIEAYFPGSEYDVGPGILKFESNDTCDYIFSDATNAYDSTKLSKFTRQLVYYKPDIFIILDDVRTKDAAIKKSWVVNPGATPNTIGDSLIIIENGPGKLWIKRLLPADVNQSLSDDLIEVSPANSSKEDLFLFVMQATDSELPQDDPLVIADQAKLVTEGDTLRVQIDGREILFDLTGDTISDVTPVTGISNAIGSDIVNAATTYTVSFRVAATGGALTAGSGTITVTFPNNTFLPATMATSVVQVANGAAPLPTNYANANAVSVNTLTRTVVVTVPNAISDNHYVSLAFLAEAGLENPSNTGGYTLNVKTSSQPLNGESASYTLQATNTTISELSVSITPQTVSQPGRFQYNFTTGARGRLISGQNLIYLLLPDDISFSQGTPQTSKVTVNSIASEALLRKPGTGQEADTLAVTVPLSVTIGNNTAVTVIIDETAGVITPSTAGVLTYSAYTSVESAGIDFDKPLPVDLSSFTARAGNGRVTLQWITAVEIENDAFIIDRSTDGENFEFLAEIKGQGSISRQTKYSYTDKAVINGFTYHYRLTDRDYNGILTHHQTIQATPNSSGIDLSQTSVVIDKFALQFVYPNPFNPETTIRFDIPTTDNKVHGVKMMIYNILGQRVSTLFDGELAGGRYKVKWNGIRQASGVYYLHFQSDTYVKTQKMLLVR